MCSPSCRRVGYGYSEILATPGTFASEELGHFAELISQRSSRVNTIDAWAVKLDHIRALQLPRVPRPHKSS